MSQIKCKHYENTPMLYTDFSQIEKKKKNESFQ